MLNKLKNIFLNKALKANKTSLNSNYLGSIPSHITYSEIKQALSAEDLGALIRIFEHFKRFDTQISSELNRRKMQVVRLPFLIETQDEAQRLYLENFCKSVDFRLFLQELSSAVAFGFAAFFIDFEAKNTQLYPKPRFISHRYFESDETMRAYICQGANKIYLDDESVWSYFHPTDSGNLIERSLIYKIVCIAALKHVAISRYMNFLDSLAVPPLIIKSEATQDKELSDLVLKCALDLRSNGVGLFGKDDDIDVLNGNVDKESFLSFIRYCDECISKLITGQVLAGNSVQNGTQALGTVHQNIQRETMEFDAALLSAGVSKLLQKALELNFIQAQPFSFELDTNTERDEKLQADTYAVLASMGVKIPIEHLQKAFKIAELEYSPLNIDFNRENQGSLSPHCHSVSFKQERTKSFRQTEGLKLFNKATTLTADEFERFFVKFKEDNADFDFESFEAIFLNATSFENAEKELLKSFKSTELKRAENLLFELSANSKVLSDILGDEND